LTRVRQRGAMGVGSAELLTPGAGPASDRQGPGAAHQGQLAVSACGRSAQLPHRTRGGGGGGRHWPRPSRWPPCSWEYSPPRPDVIEGNLHWTLAQLHAWPWRRGGFRAGGAPGRELTAPAGDNRGSHGAPATGARHAWCSRRAARHLQPRRGSRAGRVAAPAPDGRTATEGVHDTIWRHALGASQRWIGPLMTGGAGRPEGNHPGGGGGGLALFDRALAVTRGQIRD